MAYTKHKTLLDTSASSVTGGPMLIADYTQLTISWVTQVGGASTLTVQMSNEHGLNADFGTAAWSHITGLSAQGEFGVETGSRWMRVLRASASSATVQVSALYNR